MPTTPVQAELGVFGGSGFYSFLENVEERWVHTPFGAPSAPVAIGEVAGRKVAFLPRHGAGHETPAHRVNYRANVWAMHELGVGRIIGPCAAGSLRPEIAPGDVVVLDQFVDRTSGRGDTFFDGGQPGHVSMADPYCPDLSGVVAGAADIEGVTVHRGGTVVVVQGPRFSTRAESSWFRSAGWHTVNMTQYPEVALCRELGMCYVGMAIITDYDTGAESDERIAAVQMHDVFAQLKANVGIARNILKRTLANVPPDLKCSCVESLNSGPFASG